MKTGADAVFVGLKLLSKTIVRYRVKLLAFVDAQWAAGHISADQNTLVHQFIDDVVALSAAFEILASYNNVPS